MIGQRIGSYSLIGEIGFGGMGAVYKAEDRRSGRIVAVKMLKDTLCERKAVERFLREGEILQKLESHPGMVTVYEVGCVEGRYFMAMEYVEGTTLAEWIRAQGRLSPEETVEMALALCDVLAFVHRKGIVHRDIKPGHILRSVEGPIKLMDFGLAKDLDCSTITAADVMMGPDPLRVFGPCSFRKGTEPMCRMPRRARPGGTCCSRRCMISW